MRRYTHPPNLSAVGASRGASLVVVAASAWGARGRGPTLAGGWAAPGPGTLGRLACKVLSQFERKKPPIKPRTPRETGTKSIAAAADRAEEPNQPEWAIELREAQKEAKS